MRLVESQVVHFEPAAIEFLGRRDRLREEGGDARLIIWTLAWDNHALMDGVRSLFDANIFYPARNALAYSEHLFGISVFTLPIYAATRNPVLAYNIVWLLSYALAALTAHYVAWRHTRPLSAEGPTEAVDPVCGMTVSLVSALTLERDGVIYAFCGPGCRDRFEVRAP